MSWDSYVNVSLVQTGFIDKAAIFDVTGQSVWAASPNYEIEKKEMKDIVDAYADTKDVKDIQASGFHIAKERYVTIRADEKSIYGKQGKTGIIIVKTKQALLVAHYPETVQPGQATNVVENLADYLIRLQY